MFIRFSIIAALCTVLFGFYSLALTAKTIEGRDVRNDLQEQEILPPVSFNTIPVTLDESDPRSTIPLDLKDELETLDIEETDTIKEA